MSQIKDIPNYPGYKVDDIGNVYSYRKPFGTGKWIESDIPKILKPGFTEPGRGRVVLMKDNQRKNWNVSTLVMLAFVGPRSKGMFVCHNDGNPNNNKLENLRYDTPINNSADRKLHGTNYGAKGIHHGIAKLNNQKVKLARLLFKEFNWSLNKIKALWGISSGAMYAVLKNITWKHI